MELMKLQARPQNADRFNGSSYAANRKLTKSRPCKLTERIICSIHSRKHIIAISATLKSCSNHH